MLYKCIFNIHIFIVIFLQNLKKVEMSHRKLGARKEGRRLGCNNIKIGKLLPVPRELLCCDKFSQKSYVSLVQHNPQKEILHYYKLLKFLNHCALGWSGTVGDVIIT